MRVCHVDGFRFDLAPLFEVIKACPLLLQAKLIAESWDVGLSGYQAGNFPPLFAEWNDHFRADMRRLWLYRDVSNGAFSRRFAASSGLFQRDGRLPHAAVNLITAHDGFTLRDLVSFN